MSWTTVFPVLTDEMVEQYEAESTGAERSELDGWFSIQRVINPQPRMRHVVSTSLFWKNPRGNDPELPSLDRKTLKQARKRGLVCRYEPWSHYVEPLLAGARQILSRRTDVTFRVYLAADLEFLVKDLVKAGCEIRLMKSSSVRHNPGAMWRFLALEEKDSLVTLCDSDRAPMAEPDILRTEEMAKAGLGLWRVPVWGDLASDGTVPYRPMFGGQFGGCPKLPMRRLMKAFVWHSRRGTISAQCQLPACGERPINGGTWPDYGFDEYFLIAAVYPRAARKGVLSFIPSNARSRLLPLDIEYVTWANPRSELVYFGMEGCCAPAETVEPVKPVSIRGLMQLNDFELLATKALTQRHLLPGLARRMHPENAGINGSVWAWYNPSVASWRGKRWLAYRTECSPRWHWSRVSLAQLDDDGGVITGSNKLLTLPTGFGIWGAEDPRLSVADDRLLLSYNDGWRTGLAEIDEHGKPTKARLFRQREYVEGVVVTKDRREKNWGFFENKDGLFVSYWVAPHVVFRCDERRAKLGERWQTSWKAPTEVGELHGGSSPVLHDGLLWRVVHSAVSVGEGFRRYQLWLMAFRPKPPFAPRWFCRKPLVVAEREKKPVPEQVQNDVVFCGSLERVDKGWRIFFGENDRRIRFGTVPDALIAAHLIRLRA